MQLLSFSLSPAHALWAVQLLDGPQTYTKAYKDEEHSHCCLGIRWITPFDLNPQYDYVSKGSYCDVLMHPSCADSEYTSAVQGST